MDNKYYHALIAGFIESIFMQPFDMIKVLKQSGQHNIYPKIKNNPNMLYNGFMPFTTGMVIKYGLRFSVINNIRSKSNDNNIYINLLSGFIAGFVESIFITPFELIKIRLQTQSKNSYPLEYKNLYRGYLSMSLRQSINQSTNIAFYYHFRNEEPTFLNTSILGFISGSIGPIINNPFDVIKTRFMNPNFKYLSMKDALIDIRNKHGYYYLFTSGLGLRILRVGLGQTIIFNTLETLKYYDY